MKINFIKYIFIIFVIATIIFVVYQLNTGKENTEPEQPLTSKEEETIKEITLGIAEFDTMNPILSQNRQVQEICKIIYEPLLELDAEYKIQKCLAKDWAKTAETTYLVRLRDDVKWSDGQNLTADDVIFTINTLKGISSIYYSNVEHIISAEKIDSSTIQIIIDQEIPFFEYNLIFPIMNQNFYAGQDFSTSEKNNAPIGTGKYKIIQNDSASIVLSKNENYTRDKLTLEKITIDKYSNLGELYNAFKLGKIDLITTTNVNIEDYIGTIGYNKVEIPGREFDFLAINTKNTILANKEVRQAISRAINKDNIVTQIYNNKYKVTNYVLDYGSWLSGETGDNSYNPEVAKQILIQNRWEYKYQRWQKRINYSTKQISFRLVVQASNQARVSVAEMIKTNLEEIGMKVTIVKASDNQYQNYLKNKNYDMILTGTTVGTSPNLETFFGATNLANYSNEEISTIMSEVKNITKEDLLKEKYARIREIFNDEVPYIGLYNSYYAIASSWSLKGSIAPNWYNLFLNINNWYKV